MDKKSEMEYLLCESSSQKIIFSFAERIKNMSDS